VGDPDNGALLAPFGGEASELGDCLISTNIRREQAIIRLKQANLLPVLCLLAAVPRSKSGNAWHAYQGRAHGGSDSWTTANLLVWTKGGVEKANGMKVLNPLTVRHVRLSAWNILYVSSVDEEYLES